MVHLAAIGFDTMNYEVPSASRHTGEVASVTEVVDLDDEAQQARRRRQLIVGGIVAALVVLALALWMFFGKADDPALADGATQVPVVSVVVPGRESVAGTITASGTIAARRPLPVGSVGEGGQVVAVRVDEGDWVRQGQVLAVVDRSVQTQQISAQAAQVEVARADARLAQANLDRALALVQRGFISKADVDRLTSTRDAANARVRVAQSQLGELRARTARLNIVAPAGGLVLERNVELGQVVGGGAGNLFVLAQGGEMELAALVGESELARLSVGASAQVAPVGSGRVFAGQVWQLSPTIAEDSRQGEARVALAYDRALRPGGFATATIGTGGTTAPMLPESAIQNDDKGAFVFVVDKSNKVRRRAIKTGLVTDAGITIVEGLTGDERVVQRAGGFLFEGDTVKPRLVRPAA